MFKDSDKLWNKRDELMSECKHQSEYYERIYLRIDFTVCSLKLSQSKAFHLGCCVHKYLFFTTFFPIQFLLPVSLVYSSLLFFHIFLCLVTEFCIITHIKWTNRILFSLLFLSEDCVFRYKKSYNCEKIEIIFIAFQYIQWDNTEN